ncbi:MAG: diguanylate cyclase [Gemmataceae bacterium]
MKPHLCTVLLVDDEPYLLLTLETLLRNDFHVLTATSADEAEKFFAQQPIHILLTDQRMPRRTGIQLLEWVRQHHPHTIRLLMTGFSEIEDAVSAINQGQVYHYLHKPWRAEELLQVMHNAAETYWLRQKQEELLEQLKALNNSLELLVEERTRELQQANAQLEQRNRELERLALTDSLTGLLNRRAIEDLIDFELRRLARFPSSLAVGYVDLDHFKQINTNYTHIGGDEALRQVARILSQTVREVDSVARIGGEEFLILARETPFDGAATLAERIREAIEQHCISCSFGEIRLTVSIGFAVADGPTERRPLMQLAAQALAEAKQTGRNRAVLRLLRPTAVGV